MNHNLRDYYLRTLGYESLALNEPPQAKSLQMLASEVAACQSCELHKSRTQTVFSRGSAHARLMVIGEAPGFHEDKMGIPFVGKAGKLLDKMLQTIGLGEENFYIANILKCRPPNNRDPQVEEIQTCGNYLKQQIELINPAFILALGRFAGQFLLQEKSLTLAQMRNMVHYYNAIPVLVSYHPAYLLRNSIDKKSAYLDLLKVKQFLC